MTPRTITRTARILLPAAAVALLVPGAASATTGDGPIRPLSRCSTRIEDRNLALFEERLGLLLSGNVEGSRSYFSDDGVVTVHGSVPFAGTYTVQDGAYEAMRAEYFVLAPPEGEMPEPTLYADCDKVILVGPLSSQVRATGETVSTTVIEIFTFDTDGKIVSDDLYYTDTAAVLEAFEPDA
jgi:ketosteroid isomerase-like protein